MSFTDRFTVYGEQGNRDSVTCNRKKIPTPTAEEPHKFEWGLPHYQLSDGTSLNPVEGDGTRPGDVFEDIAGQRYTRN